jgi:hypothetical protein
MKCLLLPLTDSPIGTHRIFHRGVFRDRIHSDEQQLPKRFEIRKQVVLSRKYCVLEQLSEVLPEFVELPTIIRFLALAWENKDILRSMHTSIDIVVPDDH